MATKKIPELKEYQGAIGFSKEYWIKNYSDLEDMDGVVNAKSHALYLKSFFEVEFIEVDSIVDLGAGLGFLSLEMIKAFDTKSNHCVEPSEHAFSELLKNKQLIKKFTKFSNTDLLTFLKMNKKNRYDLGICTSVFQYLSDKDIEKALSLMSSIFKYVYFSVPTKDELLRQRREGFYDEFAILRSKSFYQKALRPHFTVVGSRILESKKYFDATNTNFTDLLFRS